jgi:deoxyribodipyrimidine photo-lyase
MPGALQIIWFKRDLRLVDHAPLAEAARAGPVLALVVVEPDYWRLPDTSYRQYRFWSGCVADLGGAIAGQGGVLHVHIGDVIDCLETLRAAHGPFTLWSHEETGNGWTHRRDRAVRRFMAAHHMEWREFPQFGVIRGKGLNRDRWAAGWDGFMARPVAPAPARVDWVAGAAPAVPNASALGLEPDGILYPAAPGRAAGLALLDSFLHRRGQRYTREMSSPVTAAAACSRLSPYIAYGCLSMREIAQAAYRRASEISALPPGEAAAWGSALRSFIARLHWHCHFIQKLEAEPAVETRPFARVYEGLRPNPGNPDFLSAWITGMRYLIAHGWINFRMRALLMSFATYDLFLSWQEAGTALARLFTDYEPGIHWPQCQMQSGETGINTVRVYSPVKQGFDQDPNGDFIREWVPELRGVPGALVHEPWRLPEQQRAMLAYPERIVDHDTAVRIAKNHLFSLRRLPAAQAQADAVQRRHGSRNRTGRKPTRKTPLPQLTLRF